MTGLQVQAPGGGRLSVEQIHLRTRIWELIRGRWETKWTLGEIRMDPSSWGIRAPLAREILSAGPVATDGFARLALEPGKVTLRELELHGPLLRLQAQGSWLFKESEVKLLLKGGLARSLLEGMELSLPDPLSPQPWEPFEFRLRGAWAHPEIRFDSSFYTFSFGERGT